jgi:hypothetical protein
VVSVSTAQAVTRTAAKSDTAFRGWFDMMPPFEDTLSVRTGRTRAAQPTIRLVQQDARRQGPVQRTDQWLHFVAGRRGA